MNSRSLCVRLNSVHILGKQVTPSSLTMQFKSQVFHQSSSSSDISEVPIVRPQEVSRKKPSPLPTFMTEYLYESHKPKTPVRSKLSTRPSTGKTLKRREAKTHKVRSQSIGAFTPQTPEKAREDYRPQIIRISPRASVKVYSREPVLQMGITPIAVTSKRISRRKTRIPRAGQIKRVESAQFPDFTEIIERDAADPPAFSFGEKLWKFHKIATAINFV